MYRVTGNTQRGEGEVGCLVVLGILCLALYGGYRLYEEKQSSAMQESLQASERVRAEEARQLSLHSCLDTAEQQYWDYVRLNGGWIAKRWKDKGDEWRAPKETWEAAAR